MRCLGIDPAKDIAHCALVDLADSGARPLLVAAESLRWAELSGWVRLVELVSAADAVACEAQWCAENDTSKWSGIAPLLETTGAVRVACLTAGRELVRYQPSEWRAVALSPRPFHTRPEARRTEREVWTALWAEPRLDGSGPVDHQRLAAHVRSGQRVKLPPGLGPDTGAGALIALALAGKNAHTWISL